MEEAKEITIRIKGEDKTCSFKHLVYNDMACSAEDDVLKTLLECAKQEFVGDIEDVTVTIRMVL